MNSLRRAKLLIRNLICTLCVCVKLFAKRRHNYGQTALDFFQHDNAPSHTVLILSDHFPKKTTYIVPQPPDLAPCNFWLFLKLKRLLQGGHSGMLVSLVFVCTRLLFFRRNDTYKFTSNLANTNKYCYCNVSYFRVFYSVQQKNVAIKPIETYLLTIYRNLFMGGFSVLFTKPGQK